MQLRGSRAEDVPNAPAEFGDGVLNGGVEVAAEGEGVGDFDAENVELLRVVDPELKTVAALREEAANKLKARAEEKARLELEEKAIEAAVAASRVEFPPVLAEIEIDRNINQQLQSWQMDEKGLSEYLSRIGKTEEDMRNELRPAAEQRVIQSLVLGKIAEAP